MIEHTDDLLRIGAAFCVHCGETIVATPGEDLAEAGRQIAAHDAECEANPTVQRVRELEDENKRLRDALAAREDDHR